MDVPKYVKTMLQFTNYGLFNDCPKGATAYYFVLCRVPNWSVNSTSTEIRTRLKENQLKFVKKCTTMRKK